jgi:hypothetical protein
MQIELNVDDLAQLNEDGHIIANINMDSGEKEAEPLLLVTMEYLQMLADGFSAGHALLINGLTISGNPENMQCPKCSEGDCYCEENDVLGCEGNCDCEENKECSECNCNIQAVATKSIV